MNTQQVTEKKVISFTLAKNEEDIIESFVRHHVRFIDHIFILDNGSSDGTLSILRALQAEGLPLTVIVDDSPSHDQSKRVTRFYRAALKIIDFDLIVFLDADEFLFPEEHWKDNIQPEQAYEVKRYLHLFPEVECKSSDVLNAMSLFRVKPQSSKGCYAIGNNENDNLIRIGEGSHNIFSAKNNLEKRPLPATIRHYAIRSVNQYIRKNVIGWLAMIVRDVENANSNQPFAVHWRKEYNYILKNNGNLAHNDVLHRLHGAGFSKLPEPPQVFNVDFPPQKYQYLKSDTPIFTQLTNFSIALATQLSQYKTKKTNINDLEVNENLELFRFIELNFSNHPSVKKVWLYKQKVSVLDFMINGKVYAVDSYFNVETSCFESWIFCRDEKIDSNFFDFIVERDGKIQLLSNKGNKLEYHIVSLVLVLERLLNNKFIS